MADSATQAAAEPFLEVRGGAPSRLRLDGGGRAHVDRALPFLILNRGGGAESLAARVAATSSAYVVWPGPNDDQALQAIDQIARRAHDKHGRVLLVSIYDLPRDVLLDPEQPKLEAFTARLSASPDEPAQAAAKRLTEALEKIEIDLRNCSVEHVSEAWFVSGVEDLVQRLHWLSHISLGLPQTYRVPGQDAIYPQLLHELEISVFDALLQASHAFLAEIAPDPPKSHRALGRRSFIDAARSVDRKLLRISTSFDFLLSVSPINSEQAYDKFKADKFDTPPTFRYRPLTVDPDLAKRALYAIDLRRVEDPVLEHLFAEKRRELDQQLTMLACRNSGDFRYVSLTLYGPVEPALLAGAREVLDRVSGDRHRGEAIGADAVRKAARALIADYRQADPEFNGRIEVRQDIPAGLMVSGRTLMISQSTRMPKHRLDALLQHEVSVHLLTFVNGNAQGLKIFRTGLAGYEGVQEGLGVFAECAVGGLTAARLRLLAARVVVVDAMIAGAEFIEAFRLLKDQGFGSRMSFNVAARVYRSGGLSKDAIYLRGFRQVLDLLAAGSDLTPFWYGKIAARHVPVIEELAARGLLQAPRTLPQFLARPDAQARIATMRTAPALSQLI
ncbi:flavohemoglobin expression-modulating QEGLA motif protein [Sphingomonas sp.]|uniref:flavohemoglobin expression-modulating QEGLA motif protein n=1 Tax=Sphingomonas sp. TaxID=28214 RepID=UPI0017EB001A|nr:flavohemoglobin expression-modulating QEGLA motif protein [Sphingomonas sp.]MBA3511463.1 flavohemoglobin expression-modulating QEGLA motif protein [Sphingomonas sp.]